MLQYTLMQHLVLLLLLALVSGYIQRIGGFSTTSSHLNRISRFRQSCSLYAATQTQSHKNESKSFFRVVIIGGGVGGLATAARLASSSNPSCMVTVLEKNQQVGGRSGSYDVTIPNLGTFRHERGPSLLLLPHVYRALFEDCSATPEDFGLFMEPCLPAYQVVFDDGDRLDVGFPSRAIATNDKTLQQLREKSKRKMDTFETDGAKKWEEYMRATSAFLDCGLPNFIEEKLDLKSFPAFLVEALRDFGKAWPLKPHSDVLDAIFESEKMRALASFQDLYVGLEPYRNDQQLFGGVIQSTAPAVFGLLAVIELHPDNDKAGVFAPIGGFRAVSESFQKLAEARGVEIRTGSMVTRMESNGVYTCSPLDKESQQLTHDDADFVPADLIICNADLPYATNSLLPMNGSSSNFSESTRASTKEPRFDWDDSFLYSSGVVAFHWSLDKEMVDLNTHNVFLAAAVGRSQAEESWRTVRSPANAKSHESNTTVEPFNFYVHCPTKTDPTAAPDGCDSIMVLVPCRTLKRNQDYAKLSREEALDKYKAQFDGDYIFQLREAVLKRLAAIGSLENLRQHIVDEVVDTPGTYADQYHVGAGTPFALSHGFGQLSITRPGPSYNMDSNSKILYCGASSRPGNGVPLVLIGSRLIAEKALLKLEEMWRIRP